MLQGPVTILLDSQETRSGSTHSSKAVSGTSTPVAAEDASQKEAARKEFLAQKQRKKEEYERRQAENKQKKEAAATKWTREQNAKADVP